MEQVATAKELWNINENLDDLQRTQATSLLRRFRDVIAE